MSRARDIKNPRQAGGPAGEASQRTYHENESIISQERAVCKGVFGWRRH